MTYEIDRVGATKSYVSWDGTGNFDGAYDDGSADLSRTGTLIIELGRDSARALGRPRAALASWRYRNSHRRYSTENASSPLRGELIPGRPCRIEKTIGEDTATMSDVIATMSDAQVLMSGVSNARLFTGTIDEPAEQYGPGPNKRYVNMRALGSLAKLQAVTSVTIALQLSITTGAAMVLLMQAAGLSASEYVIDQAAIDSGRELDYWYVDGRPPLTVAQELWASEGPTSALYEDVFGRLVFEGNTYLFDTTRCNTVQATYYANRDDGMHFIGLEIIPGTKQIINDAVLQYQQRATQNTQVVAEYSGSITLAAAESQTVVFRVQDPLAAHTTPVLTTDYTVTGTALASVTSSALGALAVAVTFTAGAGSAVVGAPSGGNGPRLRGQPMTVISTLDVNPTVDASDSQATYGIRSLPTSLYPWVGLNPTDMAAVADAWLLAYRDSRPAVMVTLVNATGLLLHEICGRQISDLIRVVDEAESGAVLDLTINSIRHEITSDFEHLVTFGCEKRIEQTWGRFDVAHYDSATDGRYGQ